MPGPIKKKSSVSNFIARENNEGQTVYFGGRTSGAWGYTFLFYGVFYGMLSAFWISCFTGMQSYLPQYSEGPELQDIILDTEAIYLQTYPGRFANTKDMVTYPGGVVETGDIALYSGKNIEKYLDGFPIDPLTRTVGKLANWITQSTDHALNPGQLTQINTFCGGENFGWDTKQPCFFLRLNRIRGRKLLGDGTSGGNETANDCRDGTATGDYKKVNDARDCRASGAAFLPVSCTETETDVLTGAETVTDTSFTVVSFLGDEAAGSVGGFAHVPFLNNANSLGYRDPIVVVRADQFPVDAEGEAKAYGKIGCRVHLHANFEDVNTKDKETGAAKNQRVVNSISYGEQ